MKIEIWSDFACPFCYIGKSRFEKVLSQLPFKNQVEVVYKAYQLNPHAPTHMEGTAYEAFAKGHGTTVEQAKQRFQMFTENAKTEGLIYDYQKIQMTNTFDAHRLAKWANTLGFEGKMTDRLMKAYFTEGYNLADIKTLIQLADEVGLNREEAKKVLESDQFEAEARDQMIEAKDIGVQGVPFFVIDRKYGISGAQPPDYFKQALEQIWKDTHGTTLVTPDGNDEQGSACTDEGCEVPQKK
jgi:predicted DsbA family dithiol-disulfide isomerase